MMAGPTKPTAAPQPVSPIEVLPTDVAKIYTHVHPILVLSLFYLSFNATVADPVASLTKLLPPLAILQAAYMILCLPPASTDKVTPATPAPTAKAEPRHAQPARRSPAAAKSRTKYTSKIIPTFLSLLLSSALTSPPLLLLLVLHGAPLTTHHTHTLLLSLHLSLLTTPPLFYIHGVSSDAWRALVSLSAPIDEASGAALGALLGTWVGAVPIPLDWDRAWQAWPITCVVGAYGGWALGKVVGGTVGKGFRVVFEG